LFSPSPLEPSPPLELETTGKSSRLSNIHDRRAKINRSKSSHDVLLSGIDFSKEDDEIDGPESPNTNRSSNYQRRKSVVGPVDPEYKVPSTEESSSLSSWARYLKNKYGKDRQQPESPKSPKNQTQRSPVEELPKFNFSTNPYMNKRKMLLKFGSRGSESGNFTWPRGIATGPNNEIVVADSSNHRIQVFSQEGNFIKEFGKKKYYSKESFITNRNLGNFRSN
jgi:tripartite motif-containing protein 71